MSDFIENDEGWPFLKVSEEQAIRDSTRPYDSKKNVWVPDPEDGFVTAEVRGSKGDLVSVVTDKGNEISLKREQIQEMNPPKFEKTDDMANLTFLNEASVLHNLRQRYYAMMIYTYSGLFCVVINPYKRLPIYSEPIIKYYMGKRRTEAPPHLFAVADEAYRNMVFDRENQSMLITGESGAGKTENTKKVIAYFAIVGATQQAAGKRPSLTGGKKHGTLEEQIVRTNPVLEAFGNAKTVRNNNSSRFGKFIRVHFSAKGKLSGGDIEHYLLEKSRVIRQAPGERCFHIFYQIMSGQLKGLREMLELTHDLTYYHFQSQAELTIEGVDDREEMKITDESFDIMGFEQFEKDNLYKLCAAVMHMGEMKFKLRPREEQAEVDTPDDAIRACNRFGVNHDEFLKALLKPRVRVGNEWVNKGQNLDQVHWSVGALAKAIYARMFHWLIKRCNKTLDVAIDDRKYFIGVLDIAGFEIFDLNSFEQLWINFVNERLQQFFNHHMFVLEQEEYQREGIRWEFIDFGLDLQACIELLEKPLGIVSMLDEECIVPKATDMTYVQKVMDQQLGKHPNFQRPKPPKGKQSEAHMAIVHYAGTVRYNVTNWLEKNKDPLNDTAISVLKSAVNNQLLLDIWDDYLTQEEMAEAIKAGTDRRKGKAASFMTVSMMYRESLSNLMNMLNKTHPHFIRCIIPNEMKQSGVIDAGLVLNQLTCNGVLEGIRICRKGFPNRVLYPDFKQRYAILASDEASSSTDPKTASEKMTNRLMNEQLLREEEFRLGNTKIFFKAGILARMEDLRDQKLSVIMISLQTKIRYYLAQRETSRRKKQRDGFIIIQNNIRAWIELRTWAWFRLYGRVRGMLRVVPKIDEQTVKLEEKIKVMEKTFSLRIQHNFLYSQIKELEAVVQKESNNRKILQEQYSQLQNLKEELAAKLDDEKKNVQICEEKMEKLNSLKISLEKQITELGDKLSIQEDRANDLAKAKKRCEQEIDGLNRRVQESELALKKSEAEKQSKDNQIKSLQDEMASQEETSARLNREKKQQEEMTRKLMDDLQGEDDKLNQLARIKAKLEQQLDDMENALDREKRSKQEVEKAKRKAEGDLKVAHENMDEMNKQRHDLEQNVKKKEIEHHSLASRLEDEQSLCGKLQRQIKEMQQRIQDLESELEAERSLRSKAEKSRSELQGQIQELADRLDEAGGMTAAQIELNKKRETELAKLRRDLEESNMNHETQLNSLRKKHNDAVTDMGDQLDQLQKLKAKTDKDKLQLQQEVENMAHALDAESKSRQEADKIIKQLELQLAESQAKSDEQVRQLADLAGVKNRLSNENAELLRQAEDQEQQMANMSRSKAQIIAQLEDCRRNLEVETREKNAVVSQLKNFEHENQTLHDQLEAENETKADLHRQISKLNAEIQQWKAKFENEGLAKLEEIEEAKRKLMLKVQEIQEAFEASNVKTATLEKLRMKLIGELEDAQVDVERVSAYAQLLERRQKDFDKIVDSWRKKVDDLSAELDASQRDNRNLSTECFKLKNAQDELLETVESLRRENKTLSQEMKDMSDQLSESTRAVNELQKIVRRLELEKDELQTALDEAESALEAEESKVLRAQVEVAQIRQEIEKRIREKEEEFENTRKQHQRALDSMQATLEAEAKGRAEALRLKKKLESDINELEVALDHANKANADAQRNLRLYQDQVRELQLQIEEEQRQREEIKEQLISSEKRCATLQSEKEDLLATIETADRARRQAEHDANELREQVNDLNAQNSSLNAVKRKLEAELQVLRAELDESMNEIKKMDELSKKAMADATRLAEELRQEQEHSLHLERLRKGLEQQLKEMQARLDEAEQAALRGGKKIIQQLEAKIRLLEQDVDAEQRRHQETDKNLRKVERRAKELEFQLEEEKRNEERVTEIIDKLQQKLKIYKRQLDEMEEVAAINLAKYRQAQQQLDDADERADVAENSLAKLRARARTAVSVVPLPPLPPLLMSSASATVLRSASSVGAVHRTTVATNGVGLNGANTAAASSSSAVGQNGNA